MSVSVGLQLREFDKNVQPALEPRSPLFAMDTAVSSEFGDRADGIASEQRVVPPCMECGEHACHRAQLRMLSRSGALALALAVRHSRSSARYRALRPHTAALALRPSRSSAHAPALTLQRSRSSAHAPALTLQRSRSSAHAPA